MRSTDFFFGQPNLLNMAVFSKRYFKMMPKNAAAIAVVT